MSPPLPDPYCGTAPLPGDLLAAWNIDTVLIAALALSGCLLWRTAQGSVARLSAIAATSVLFLAFVSPLCALASALFSARVFHHILLVSCAAPLIALALPRTRIVTDRLPGQLSFLISAALLWLWHAPQPYLLALSSSAVYWLMEITLLASAVWLWRDILLRPAGASLALLFGTLVQMGMLGALLTFAREPLFSAHFTTTQPFGLTSLEDQQLSGLLMWVPVALPYVAFGLLRLHRLLSSETTGDRAPRAGNAAS